MMITRRSIFARFGGWVTNWRLRISRKSLRFRLVLWVTLILCGIQLILGSTFYLLMSSWLQGQLDHSLSATAAQISAPLQAADYIDNGRLNFQLSDEPAAAYLQQRLFFVRIIDQQQLTIIDSSAPYAVEVTAQAASRDPVFETLDLVADEPIPMRIYTLPLEEDPLALQVGVSMTEIDATLTQILHLIIAALVAVVICGGGGGLFLATRALIPVQAITRTARQISEHDLSQRITGHLAEDELGQLAQTFNTMLDRIERGLQRQQRFTADAAHELRTPLSIIQTGIDVILAQDRPPAQYRAALETIREEVQRLTTLTVNLLTLARADAHTLTLNRQPMDLALLVHTVADQFTPLAEQKNLVVQRHITPQLPLSADEDRLIQMTINLIENAIKYTPEGGSITVSADKVDGQPRLTVTNTGSGIAPEHLPHLFDRFYRLDRSRQRDQGGFGLGLAIAQQIAQLHGGTITVASEPGVSTEFMVILPTS